MRIYLSSGEFDLPSGVVLEIEKKNPFFNSVGEKTLPIVLPLTSNNKRLIGINSLDNAYKPTYKLDVVIEDGAYQFIARQIIHNITSAGISCTFYMGLSKFWEKANDSNVRSLLVNNFYSSNDLYKDLIRSMDYSANYDFVAFACATKLSDDEYFVVNELDSECNLVGEDSRTVTENDVTTQVPAGYGVSCYIKVHRLLDIVISKLGYTLKPSFFNSTPFDQLVMLNNVVDLITINVIKYEQLVPDFTVQELLDIFRKRFNIEFYADENKSTVEIVRFDYSNRNICNLSETIVGEKTFDFKEEFSKITLKISKNDEESNTEGELITDLTSKYSNIAIFTEDEYDNINILRKYDCLLRAAESRFYAVEVDDNDVPRLTDIGSINYNYNTSDDMPEEAIELIDEAVAMIDVNGKLLPLVGSAAHYNTTIKDADNSTSSKNFPIKLCFAKRYNSGDNTIGYGSISEYDKDGEQDIDYSLCLWGESGIFSKFYASRDAMMRHSNYIVTAKMLLPSVIANNINVLDKFYLDSQFYCADTIKHCVGSESVQECTFRSLRLYKPYDLAAEQQQVVLSPISHTYIYYWKMESNANDLIPQYSGAEDYGLEWVEYPSRPGTPPTEAEYNAGGEYFESTVEAKLICYEYGNPTSETLVDVDTWWVAARK